MLLLLAQVHCFTCVAVFTGVVIEIRCCTISPLLLQLLLQKNGSVNDEHG